MAILDRWFANKLFTNRDQVYKILDFRYNEGLVQGRWATSPETIFTRTLLENGKWLSGTVEELEYFYKVTYPKLIGWNTAPVVSYFWHKVTPKTIRVHSGIPALISKTMVSLIAAPGFDYEIEDDPVATVRLEEILRDNKFEDKILPEMVLFESYGGYCGVKISQDDEVSMYPIIEVVAPENVEVLVTRGRINGIIFKHHSRQGDDEIEIHEVYRQLPNDTTSITYKKYKYQKTDLVEVDMNEKEREMYQDVIISTPLPAILKNNSTVNTQFKGAPYGISDYVSSQSIFNSLDEVLSQMMTAIRFARPKRFISEDLLTNTPTGRKAQFDDFETDYEIVQGDPDNTTEQYKQFEAHMEIDVYRDAFVTLLQQALNNAGLSPTSVGLTGLEALAASAESQREREKTTLRTREMKLKLYREALSTLFERLLQFDDAVNKGVSPGTYSVKVSFNDYTIPSMEERINLSSQALAGGVVDVRHAIDMLFLDDLTEEEKDLLIRNIKIENGIPLTPDEAELAAQNVPVNAVAVMEEPEEPFLEEEEEEPEEEEQVEQNADGS